MKVDYFVRSGMTVGLGTGKASSIAIEYLGHKMKSGGLSDIKGVSTSITACTQAEIAGISIICYDMTNVLPKIDCAFSDADLVQEGTLLAVIGRQENTALDLSLIKEKVIAEAAKEMIFILEENRFVSQIDGAIPVLIKKDNWMEIAEEIDDMFLGDAEVWRRPSYGEAGPAGGDHPLVTMDGHFVLDVIFAKPISNPANVAQTLETIDGVMGHGLVVDTAYAAAISSKDGVKIRTSLFRDAFKPMQ